MKILTRYILKEMFGPTVLGFSFYTFIILMRQLFDFAGMIIKRSLPASTVFELLWLSLPNIIVLTVPMSLLFGILIAVGRMSADSEVIAMRALGISTRTIYRHLEKQENPESEESVDNGASSDTSDSNYTN